MVGLPLTEVNLNGAKAPKIGVILMESRINILGSTRGVRRRHRRKPGSLVLEILLKILLIVSFPLWMPIVVSFFIIWAIRFKYDGNAAEARRRKHAAMIEEQARLRIHGPVEEAWGRCSDALKSQAMVGYSSGYGLDLGYELMTGLARRYPNEQVFFLRQLPHPNPVLAGYAAVCLGAMGGLRRTAVPAEVFRRTEMIRIQLLKESGQCMLSEFVSERCAGQPS